MHLVCFLLLLTSQVSKLLCLLTLSAFTSFLSTLTYLLPSFYLLTKVQTLSMQVDLSDTELKHWLELENQFFTF